ncbi:MAG: C_GCAxxG_C_C family protein [Bacteroidales bacterium]|nr:C_GCAxxG_C_C family protein [Bacteroidales bacterium]
MDKKEEKALVSFRSGLNCAQAVLNGYSELLDFDNSFALNISSGFGGGMGRLQETCGAVTGSYMVLGIYNGRKYSDNAEKKEVTYKMIQDFTERFKSLNGTTDCRSLLKCDLRTEEGHRYAVENNLFGTTCEKCILDSMRIVDDIIEKQIQ